MIEIRPLVERLLDEAFHQLQHDTGEHDPEHVWQREMLRKAFTKTVKDYCAGNRPAAKRKTP